MNPEKWFKLSFAQQLGNIGSEILRANNWDKKQERELCDKSLERALELLDLTLSAPQNKSRLKELTRFREVLASWYSRQDPYGVRLDTLVQYCTEFALAGR